MPRPKKDGAPEPKRRSRHGCWPCKSRKIKCGEERPACDNCQRLHDTCDYSIRLNWGGRTKRKDNDDGVVIQFDNSPAQSFTPKSSSTSTSRPSTAAPHDSTYSLTPNTAFNPPLALSQHTAILKAAPSPLPIDPYLSHIPFEPFQDAAFEDRPASVPAVVMPPPTSQTHSGQEFANARPGHKRRKTGSTTGFVSPASTFLSPSMQMSQLHSMPMTPDSPSLPGDTMFRAKSSESSTQAHQSPEIRRLSVKSLLSDTDDAASSWHDNGPSHHGFDQGRPDIDIPRNDDAHALNVFSPSSTLRKLATPNALTPPDGTDYFPEFGFGLQATGDSQFQLDEYYSQPVAVQIPKVFEPLPTLLHANPMNLLYFHHFLNHTARILVPHDCPENPFPTILPRMAISDENLLNLLLAYSASHRARLLKHPEPRNRIAGYMEGVFPSLHEALFGANQAASITDANLATAIMLASLEIISPNAFEVPVTWQTHLQIAWKMIAARGGYQKLRNGDSVAYFLSRWFAYLDVVGSLSGSRYERGLPTAYDDVGADADADSTIDCLMGFRSGAVMLLARVAALAVQCDRERYVVAPAGAAALQGTEMPGLADATPSRRPSGTELVELPGWLPSPAVVAQARHLEAELRETQRHAHKRCEHHSASSLAPADLAETEAINEAYHLTGLIHLYCRVLGHARSSSNVQSCVARIVAGLGHIRTKGSAEACMVLPMFTAGCEAVREEDRSVLLARLAGVEASGMSQVGRARGLMESVWRTGRRWETLVRGEFLG